MIEFSERGGAWRPVSKWVGFFVRLGYGWPAVQPRPRRIALVSMPCDSAAAGLVAFGALLRDLCHPRANDIDCHYYRLWYYARQYLENCQKCELSKCDPQISGCGQLKEVTGKVRSATHPHGTYQIFERTNLTERQITFSR